MPRPATSSDLHDQMRLGCLLRLLLQAGRYQEARYSLGSYRPTWLSLVTQMQKVGPQPGEAAPAGWDVYAAVLRWCRGYQT